MTGQGWIILVLVCALFGGYAWLTYVSEQAWRRAQAQLWPDDDGGAE